MIMDRDDAERPGWVRLPGDDDDTGYQRDPGPWRGAAGPRAGGVRRLRRASNWTAAALIAGVAAATGYFAHHPQPAAPAVTAVTGTAPGSGSTAGPGKPHLSAPVATSTGSGVVVTTGPNGVKTYHYRGDN
jgi:hypothetical protein